jgi:hypothetical protein
VYIPGGSGVNTPGATSDIGVRTATGTVYTPHASSPSHPSTSFSGNAAGRTTFTAGGSQGSTLDASSSTSFLRQSNTTRSSLTGINSHPLPQGAVTRHADGSFNLAATDGRKFSVRANGTIAAISSTRERVTFAANGRIRTVHTGALDVYRGRRGIHTIVERRAGGSLLVSTGSHSGYYQRSFVQGSRTLVARTYLSGDTVFTRVYVPYVFHGTSLFFFVPPFYFAPEFYGWAYYPWDSPVYYAWGWAGLPWYGYYGPYFTVAPFYPASSLWLTDYLLGQTLADAYQMLQAAPAPDDAQAYGDDPTEAYAEADTPITPELRQAIADEVQQQLAYENAAAAQPSNEANLADLPQADVPNRYFVVSTPLNVATADERTCNLEPGNVLRTDVPASDNAPVATLTVTASRMADCPAGIQVQLSINDLEEMEANFRAQIVGGLETLRNQQGQNGLPAAPASAIAPPPRPSGEAPTDQPNMSAMLQSEQTDGARAEAQANQLASVQVAAGSH